MTWFYEEHGNRKGPVAEDDMRALVHAGTIDHSTLCWTEAFGAEWHPAGSCPFWPRQPDGVPPALPPGSVSNRWAWLSIFGPFFGNLFVEMFALAENLPARETVILALAVSFAVIYAAMLADRRALKAAGFRPGSPLWVVVPPVYFWRRMRIVEKGAWLFFLSVLVFLFQFLPSFSESLEILRLPSGLSSFVTNHYDL